MTLAVGVAVHGRTADGEEDDRGADVVLGDGIGWHAAASEGVLDELMARVEEDGAELLGPDGLLSQVTKAVLERALDEELTDHLGYEKGDAAGRGSGNSRNGITPKRVHTDVGTVDLEVPRDRNGVFDPRIVPKGTTRLKGFNERIIALYARGMTVRDIRAHLEEIYGVDVSPDLISRVTDAVWDEIEEWRNRPLNPVYPILYIDALTIKIRSASCRTVRRIWRSVLTWRAANRSWGSGSATAKGKAPNSG